jgi:hypothetical protein
LSAGHVFSMILAPLRSVIFAPGQRLTADKGRLGLF